jgi:hypothetical protein
MAVSLFIQLFCHNYNMCVLNICYICAVCLYGGSEVVDKNTSLAAGYISNIMGGPPYVLTAALSIYVLVYV